jgi:hypothetical protein
MSLTPEDKDGILRAAVGLARRIDETAKDHDDSSFRVLCYRDEDGAWKLNWTQRTIGAPVVPDGDGRLLAKKPRGGGSWTVPETADDLASVRKRLRLALAQRTRRNY